MGPVLTVDVGNSRLKARRWRRRPAGAAPECTARLDAEGGDLEGLARWLGGERADLAGLASVASCEHTERVRALLARRVERLLVAPESGLENRCRAPERVGQDRLYAAAGAAALLGRSCVVVDAGTALTVDALRVEGSSRAFLGGAIAPGPALLAGSLATGTAGLPLVEPRAGARALGQDTEEALQAGVVVGFRGAAERLVEEVAREARLADAPVVLTGGARELLLLPRPFTARVVRVEPELVHHGLLAALARAVERP